MADVQISIVVGAYNEERNVDRLVERVCTYFDHAPQHPSYELIVVEDGSQDATPQRLRALAAKYPQLRPLFNDRNRGKGYSITRGILAACGEFVLYTDADLVYPIESVDRFLTALAGGADIAIGSRVHAESIYSMHARYFRYVYQRHLVGRAYIRVVHQILGLAVSDTQCGFKLLRREAAHEIFSRLRLTSFAFDVEALFIGHLRGYRIAEVPVHYLYQEEGSSVRLAPDSARMFLDLLQIRLNALRGAYSRPVRAPEPVNLVGSGTPASSGTGLE